MFIKIFVILSLAYYIMRLFKPDFYIEMIMEGILERNKECKSLEGLRIKSIITNDVKDMCKIMFIILFCTIHMLVELIAIIILAFSYKSSIATIYLIFWILMYIKRKIDSRKLKVEKNELDLMRSNLRRCYKPSERLNILVDAAFFMYIFINVVLVGV